jgi:tryptophanase
MPALWPGIKDTTRTNIEFMGAKAVDLPVREGADTQTRLPFKGNLDVEALEALIQREGGNRVPLVMVTVTNSRSNEQRVLSRPANRQSTFRSLALRTAADPET